jgi:hypothetical protein
MVAFSVLGRYGAVQEVASDVATVPFRRQADVLPVSDFLQLQEHADRTGAVSDVQELGHSGLSQRSLGGLPFGVLRNASTASRVMQWRSVSSRPGLPFVPAVCRKPRAESDRARVLTPGLGEDEPLTPRRAPRQVVAHFQPDCLRCPNRVRCTTGCSHACTCTRRV